MLSLSRIRPGEGDSGVQGRRGGPDPARAAQPAGGSAVGTGDRAEEAPDPHLRRPRRRRCPDLDERLALSASAWTRQPEVWATGDDATREQRAVGADLGAPVRCYRAAS